MLVKLLWLVVLTFVPILELRWSIPIGIFSGVVETTFFSFAGFGLNPFLVLIVCILANVLLGAIAYFLVMRIIFVLTMVPLIKKLYDWWLARLTKKKDLVEKAGLFALIFFIAVPLPGSGSWTGSIIANLLKMDFKTFFVANTIGVTLAGIIVFLVTIGVFSFF